jgi:Tol biopolymer transport system component
MIAAGTRLGSYEVINQLGAGGMGEVYRARDTKLGRDVAVKVLPAAFTVDTERVSRFKREAQVLASLNHPHIAAIYGFETAGDAQFLVLELVEGDTLARKIARGPIPVKEALGIARQIAEALDAAHDKGIIHRDLKPTNIALTADERVKVLDFGLAKALDSSDSVVDATHSPTISFGATRAGVILGTAAYMSPEQAKGRAADKRSDVWAFGAVLFEMTTGRRAFEGEDVSDTLAAVLRGDPDWTLLPADLPPSIAALIRGCLQKDRQARVADISVVRFLLGDPMGTSLTMAGGAPAAAPGVVVHARSAWLPWTLAAVLAVALGVLAVLLWPRPAAPASPQRVNAEVGADVAFLSNLGSGAELSPDGRMLLVVAARAQGEPLQIYLRRLDQLTATPLAGTERAVSPFFSPDGQWIAFFAQGKLKKIAVTGGAAVTLCDAPNPRGGSWGDDGMIVFQPDSAPGTMLKRVSSAGGTPAQAVSLAAGESVQRWPQVLPGSKAVLYTSGTTQSAGAFDAAEVVVQVFGGERKVLQRGAYYGRYVSSGHLVYMHQGTLFAAPFRLDRLELAGPSAPAIESIASMSNNGGAQFAVSDTGTVVYVPGRAVSSAAPIEWLDHSGKSSPLRATPSEWSNPAFSPDGKQIAVDISDGSQSDVWTYDWARDTLTRLTFDAADDARPVWSPDGKRIVFASRRGDKATFNLYWQRADGTGDVQRLTESKNSQTPTSFHPGGKFIAFFETTANNGADLMILPLDGDDSAGWKPGKPTVFLNAPYVESTGSFSPDGRWLAYLSNESGRNEVFVRPFPGPGGKWQISTGGADDPTWSRVRHELFFASSADARIMSAQYTVENESFRADKPAAWSPTQFLARPRAPSRDFDLHPDGQRFAVAAASSDGNTKQDKVVLIFNYFDELRRIAPPGK